MVKQPYLKSVPSISQYQSGEMSFCWNMEFYTLSLLVNILISLLTNQRLLIETVVVNNYEEIYIYFK